MQRYTDKVYQGTSKIYESPLFEAIQEELHIQDSFCVSSNGKQCSIQSSRGFPLTITKQKCKNCQRLEKCLNILTKQLLNIQKNILEKEENLNKILAERSRTIQFLQEKIQNMSEKDHLNHFSSTFYTQPDNKKSLLPHNSSKNNIQDNKHSLSLISQKKPTNYSFVSAYNLDVPPSKIRQKTQNRRLNQNISPNSQKYIKDKVLNKLKFENQTLRNYNSTLLTQLEKLKRSKY